MDAPDSYPPVDLDRSLAPWWALPGDPKADVVATEFAFRAQDEAGEPRRPHSRRAPATARPNLVSIVRGFIRRYGWRAYALPILVIVSVVALATAGGGGSKAVVAAQTPSHAPTTTGASKAPPTASGEQNLKTDAPAAGSVNSVLQSDALPAGADYTAQGTGTFSVVAGSSPVIGKGTVRRYSIEVENGISGIDVAAFAATVQSTLSDSRSWTGGAGGTALQRVDSGTIDFHITLTSSMTVRSLCGYDIEIETSCYAPKGQYASTVNRVVINNSRWVRGDAAYIADLAAYRLYMINHEVGHALGHLHAHACLAGGLAPVMMQQTIGLKTTAGQICQANPWPYPPGAGDAPGAEAADTQINNEFNLQNE